MSDLLEEPVEAEEIEESPRAVWASVGLFVAVVVLGSGCIGLQMFLS